jgi:hypothetical protein
MNREALLKQIKHLLGRDDWKVITITKVNHNFEIAINDANDGKTSFSKRMVEYAEEKSR